MCVVSCALFVVACRLRVVGFVCLFCVIGCVSCSLFACCVLKVVSRVRFRVVCCVLCVALLRCCVACCVVL